MEYKKDFFILEKVFFNFGKIFVYGIKLKIKLYMPFCINRISNACIFG